jgi:Tfp pilus assembly protein PilN
MGPIDKLKSIGIVVLLIFTLITGASTVYLIKANTKLHTEIGVLQLKLDESTSVVKMLQDGVRVDNEALEEQIESGIMLENKFTSLDQQLADIKCKANEQAPIEINTDVKKTILKKQPSPTVKADTTSASVAIASVGRLLDEAACTANSDCKPTESPSK